METKIKDASTVILVNERGSSDLRALKGVDANGKLQTVKATKTNEPQFLKFDKQSNPLENFLSNYLRQAKNPTHFNLFAVPENGVETIADLLRNALKNPLDPENMAMLSECLINLDDAAKQQYKPINEDRIEWEALSNMGVTREALEKTGSLEAMLNYRKSPILFNVNTQARLSFREGADGRINVVMHGVRKQPQLDKPFYGNTFTDEDKARLMKTGNLGRIMELTIPTTKEVVPAFVSIDKLTNEIVAFRADKLRVPGEIKGVTLDETQKRVLAQGEAIYVEGMTANSGKTFNATVQVDADKRALTFRFDNKMAQDQNGRMQIPQKIGGVELLPEQQAKLKEGGTIYVAGLVDRQGQTYNAYVKVNNEKEKLDFYRWNPDKRQSVFPEEQSRAQKPQGMKM